MKKLRNTILIICLSYAVFLGCDNVNNPVAVSDTDTAGTLASNSTVGVTTEAKVNNYDVAFTGATHDFDASGNITSTKFSYTATYSGTDPSSNYFYLQVPECALEDQTRAPRFFASKSDGSFQYTYTDPESGTTGILWNASLSKKTESFSMEFDGFIPTGRISTTIQSGNTVGTAKIGGPCEDLIEISGVVFVDTDEDRVKDLNESGIWNVEILLDGNIAVEGSGTGPVVSSTIKTDVFGEYTFYVFPGDYTISIPNDEDVDGKVFNQQFFDSYTFAGFPAPDGSIVPEKELKDQASDVTLNFGFNANTGRLIQQFEEFLVVTNTKDVKFWISELRSASKNGKGKSAYTAPQIFKFLDDIEANKISNEFNNVNVLPDVPFQFGFGSNTERAEIALDILTRPIKTEEDIFLQELLTAWLNIVSGNGVQGFRITGGVTCSIEGTKGDFCTDNIDEFHLALLAYGEALAAQFLNPEVSSTSGDLKTSTSSVSSLDDGTEVFSSFNRTGSGGLGN